MTNLFADQDNCDDRTPASPPLYFVYCAGKNQDVVYVRFSSLREGFDTIKSINGTFFALFVDEHQADIMCLMLNHPL